MRNPSQLIRAIILKSELLQKRQGLILGQRPGLSGVRCLKGSLSRLRRRLSCFIWGMMRPLKSPLQMLAPTLTATPAEANFATSNGEALHLLDGTFGVRLAYELDEAAVLAYRDLDLLSGVSAQFKP
jgi:hypothetical protein